MTTVDPGGSDPAAVAAPVPDEDSQFYWDGLRERRLLVQQCSQCGRHRFPPMPACPTCGAPGGHVVELEAEGTIYSWIVVHHAFAAPFRDDVPYVIAVIDLTDDCRFVTRLEHQEPIRAGQAVRGRYVDHGSWTELRFQGAS